MTRRGYLDWLRGVATLLMVEAHTYDAWTSAADKSGLPYKAVIALGGFAAPAFLFLAGVALALGATSAERRGASVAEAGARARRRGWQVFGLAFLFRLQSLIISGGRFPQALLKVDILNILGLSMVLVGALWPLAVSRKGRAVLFVGMAATCAVLAPVIRSAGWLGALPDWLEMYVRSFRGRSSFSLFPWPAFALAGAVVGVWISTAASKDEERALTRRIGAVGLALVLAGGAVSLPPPFFDPRAYWTEAPAYFVIRLGLLMAAIPVAFGWNHWRSDAWSPLREMGFASLFVYWIHVEMAYGRPANAIKGELSFVEATIGYAILVCVLWGLVRLKTHVAAGGTSGLWRRWSVSRERRTPG
jgi:uncharacterized membrane protein